MPGLLLVELEGTIIYKTRKNRLSMVCEKCSHFIHMNSKNWHFVTWYLCEKLLMCQYMLFLSWKSVLLTSKSFMNAVLFKWPKFLLRSYLTKTCAISAYFMIRARFGGGWGWVLVPFIWVLKEYQMFCSPSSHFFSSLVSILIVCVFICFLFGPDWDFLSLLVCYNTSPKIY